jgi:hypothetical protein
MYRDDHRLTTGDINLMRAPVPGLGKAGVSQTARTQTLPPELLASDLEEPQENAAVSIATLKYKQQYQVAPASSTPRLQPCPWLCPSGANK